MRRRPALLLLLAGSLAAPLAAQPDPHLEHALAAPTPIAELRRLVEIAARQPEAIRRSQERKE
jgi:hypothetical protein